MAKIQRGPDGAPIKTAEATGANPSTGNATGSTPAERASGAGPRDAHGNPTSGSAPNATESEQPKPGTVETNQPTTSSVAADERHRQPDAPQGMSAPAGVRHGETQPGVMAPGQIEALQNAGHAVSATDSVGLTETARAVAAGTAKQSEPDDEDPAVTFDRQFLRVGDQLVNMDHVQRVDLSGEDGIKLVTGAGEREFNGRQGRAVRKALNMKSTNELRNAAAAGSQG